MFIEILLFLVAGVLVGILFGLMPGLHPNVIILFIPFIVTLNIGQFETVTFVISMAITNSVVNMIPSILLGAPDAGNELSILPGHKMLLNGQGYEAIKLTVVGGFGAVLLAVILLPALVFVVPLLWGFIKAWVFILLIVVSCILILSEKENKKFLALLVFIMAGSIGLMLNKIPVNSVMILFPVFSGLFGISFMLLQLKNKTSVPKQKSGDIFVSKKTLNKSVVLGTVGGIIAGFLPGVGSSQIASLATVDKNDHSFLTTLGALTTSNVLLSVLSLWLIERSRSGAAVILEQTINVGFSEFLLMVIISLITIGFSVVVTLFMAKRFVSVVEKINYSALSKFIIILIVVMTILFSGLWGLFLLATCTSLGLFANLVNIKRTSLMAVLLVPTILYFIGL